MNTQAEKVQEADLGRVRKILVGTQELLREKPFQQDLKLALVVILNNKTMSYSPDELREVGVKDVAKAVTEQLRTILLSQLPEIKLCREITGKYNGRTESSFFFAKSEKNETQLSIDYG